MVCVWIILTMLMLNCNWTKKRQIWEERMSRKFFKCHKVQSKQTKFYFFFRGLKQMACTWVQNQKKKGKLEKIHAFFFIQV